MACGEAVGGSSHLSDMIRGAEVTFSTAQKCCAGALLSGMWSARTVPNAGGPMCELTQFRDKTGNPFDIGECGAGDYPSLAHMYESSFPEAVSQGLPPTDRRRRREWMQRLLREGANFAAWRQQRVVGHCALLCEPCGLDGEFIIFVARPDRNRGVGSLLTRCALDRARSLGLEKVWLTVEAGNFPAIRLYRKFGFVFHGQGFGDRIMTLEL